jgi:hypothetical protein
MALVDQINCEHTDCRRTLLRFYDDRPEIEVMLAKHAGGHNVEDELMIVNEGANEASAFFCPCFRFALSWL